MELEKQIEELDFALLQSFSTKHDRPWGVLFNNPEQPDYYDANHAYVNRQPDEPGQVISEVIKFYRASGITPRFYLGNIESLTSFMETLKESGFQIEQFSQPIQLWNQQLTPVPFNERIAIEKVTERNYEEALAVECQIKEFGGKAVREKAFETEFNDPRYCHYVLKYDGIPCSSACLFVHGRQGRIESVATIEAYRGKGLIGALLEYIENEAQVRQLEKLWVHPINERVEKVYARSGFETVLSLQTGHAFMDGKSIKEIQARS